MQSGGWTWRGVGGALPARLAPVALFVVLSSIYLLGLHPGVDAGDSAELQLHSPLLGICHPPGYQIEVTIGHLWSLLPIGSSIAWRLNLLMAVAGVIGCLALYGSVRRITGQVLPGVASALILGLSSVYWSHSLVAEAYVFYSAFLLLGIYAVTRFVESDRWPWLCVFALSVGAAIGDRPSELFLLPAFGILAFSFRDRFHLGRARSLAAIGLFLLPFVFSVGCYLVRNHPDRLAIRDDAIRDEIIQDVSKEISRGYGPNPTATSKVAKAVSYCLGVTWVGKPGFRPSAVGRTIADYAAILAGVRAFAERPKPEEEDLSHAGKRGASIGVAGLALAAFGLRLWRKRRGWPLFGLALFGGNLLFVLWHHSWDNMTFTVPGVAGLALLAGLGTARLETDPPQRTFRRIRLALAAVSVLFLLFGNFAAVGRRTEAERMDVERGRELAAAPWPEGSVILCSYWPAMTFRYALYIDAKRTDVQVLCADPANYMKLLRHFAGLSRSVYVLAVEVKPDWQEDLGRRTDPELGRLGFLCANSVVQGSGQ